MRHTEPFQDHFVLIATWSTPSGPYVLVREIRDSGSTGTYPHFELWRKDPVHCWALHVDRSGGKANIGRVKSLMSDKFVLETSLDRSVMASAYSEVLDLELGTTGIGSVPNPFRPYHEMKSGLVDDEMAMSGIQDVLRHGLASGGPFHTVPVTLRIRIDALMFGLFSGGDFFSRFSDLDSKSDRFVFIREGEGSGYGFRVPSRHNHTLVLMLEPPSWTWSAGLENKRLMPRDLIGLDTHSDEKVMEIIFRNEDKLFTALREHLLLVENTDEGALSYLRGLITGLSPPVWPDGLQGVLEVSRLLGHDSLVHSSDESFESILETAGILDRLWIDEDEFFGINPRTLRRF